MAFIIRNLSTVAYANSWTMWHYRTTTDNLEAVGKDGYFFAVSDMLANGDIIVVNAQDGTKFLVVVESKPNDIVHTHWL